ncbi:bacteriocin immunity protein [Streptococcus pasteurianus]|uniref:bacteriocin immunity protein n=1 Tax=Streptococcus pasteurianus TaxID=197614 RepID=UPI003013E0D9
MPNLKWFSGGKERRDEALIIIDELLATLDNNMKINPLRQLLQSYHEELKNRGTSTPYILSRLNVDLSTVLVENAIHPTREQSAKLKELRALQNIRIPFIKKAIQAKVIIVVLA